MVQADVRRHRQLSCRRFDASARGPALLHASSMCSGRVLVENTPLSFSRDLQYRSTELLQKKQEEEALKVSMRQEIVRRIIRRLGGVAYHRQGPDAHRVAFV